MFEPSFGVPSLRPAAPVRWPGGKRLPPPGHGPPGTRPMPRVLKNQGQLRISRRRQKPATAFPAPGPGPRSEAMAGIVHGLETPALSGPAPPGFSPVEPPPCCSAASMAALSRKWPRGRRSLPNHALQRPPTPIREESNSLGLMGGYFPPAGEGASSDPPCGGSEFLRHPPSIDFDRFPGASGPKHLAAKRQPLRPHPPERIVPAASLFVVNLAVAGPIALRVSGCSGPLTLRWRRHDPPHSA